MASSIGRIFSLKHLFFKNFDISALGFDLNKTEERVLMMTWKSGGLPMQFLSREAGLEKGSLTTVIDSLEEKRLVERVRDKNDLRSFIVLTTTAGARQAEQIEKLFHEHLSKILGKLSPDDLLEFEKAAKTFDRLIPILAS